MPTQATIDRKSKPIYDALNRGDPKGALKLCAQALSKYPKQPLFTILKAFALERTGKVPEALKVVDDLIAQGVPDEDVQQHIVQILRAHGKSDKLIQFYTAAHESNPHDLGVLQELFLAHARVGNVIMQQQLAMKIHKGAPAELPAFWVVCSILTQADLARTGKLSTGMSVDMLLSMARNMSSKQLARAQELTFEAMLVHLDLLLAQGEYRQCMDLLEGPAGRQAISLPHELLRLKAQVAILQQNLDHAAYLLETCIRESSPDDWAAYMLLVACRLPSTALVCEDAWDGILEVQGGFGRVSATLADPVFWSSAADAAVAADADTFAHGYSKLQAFIEEMISQAVEGSASTKAGGLVRAPYLAQVDVVWRGVTSGHLKDADVGQPFAPDDAEVVGQLRESGAWAAGALVEPILAYFKRFKTKAVLHRDLKRYVEALPPAFADVLAAELDALQGAVCGTVATRQQVATASQPASWETEEVRVCVNVLRLKRYMGLPRCPHAAAAQAFAGTLLDTYVSWLPMVKRCDARELNVGEDAAEMAAAACVTAYAHDRDVTHLLKAMMILECVLPSRGYSAQLRLALCGLEGLRGRSDRAIREANQLELRQVQLDTMMHHVLPVLATSGRERYLEDVLMLKGSHHGACQDAITDCYASGTYSKILEFLAFQRKGGNSVSYMEAATELSLRAMRDVLQPILQRRSQPEALSAKVQGAVAAVLADVDVSPSDLLVVNDDLSHLPVWRTPPRTQCVFAPLEWFANVEALKEPAHRHVWWCSPSRAGSCSTAMDEWQRIRLEGACVRAARPKLLGMSLLLQRGTISDTRTVDALSRVWDTLFAASDCDGGSGEPAKAPAVQDGGSAGEAAADQDHQTRSGPSEWLRHCEALNFSTAALGVSVMHCATHVGFLSAEATAAGPLDSVACVAATAANIERWVRIVSRAVQVLADKAVQQLAQSDALLDGALLHALRLFADHDIWMLCCQQLCWTGTVCRHSVNGEKRLLCGALCAAVRELAGVCATACDAVCYSVKAYQAACGSSQAEFAAGFLKTCGLRLERLADNADARVRGVLDDQNSALESIISTLSLCSQHFHAIGGSQAVGNGVQT